MNDVTTRGWPGATASDGKPGRRRMTRTERLYRIAELIGRYRPEHEIKTGKWHLWDAEEHKRLPSEYADEDTARAGARLAAACDIDALNDGAAS